MHAMVFIINGECDIALSDSLNNKTEQQLIDDGTFIDALVGKLATGANDKGIYTKKGVNDELAKKADADGTNLDDAKVNSILSKLTGNNIVAKVSDLTTKVNVAGNNATEAGVNAMLGKLTDKVVKATELKTKAAAKDVVDSITASSDFTNKVYIKADQADEVYTKTAADTAFVKATELKTKVAEKAVVDSITASSDFTGKVYTKTAADTAFVKATELKTKAAAKDVVDAITASSDFTNKVYIKAATTDEVYTKKDAETAFVKATELKTKAAAKDVVDAIFDAKDGDKSILVDKLGGFLAENTKAYDNGKKTAKELLVPSAADLAQDHDFKQGIDKSIKEMAVSSNSDFQKNVREVMSQSYFEPPTSDDAALNLIW